jgi:hypothetical protein
MTLDEADAIIAELNICFPSKQLVVEEVKRWEQNLLPYFYEDAQKAVKRIEESSRFWPSWAEFKDVVLPIHKQRDLVAQEGLQQAYRAIERPRTTEEDEQIRQIIQGIKQRFSERR